MGKQTTYDRARYLANRDEVLARSKQWFATHKAERAAYNVAHRDTKRVYNRAYLLAMRGLTQEAFDALLISQRGGCAICGTRKPKGKGWCVDHDHATGETRGVLCSPCNFMLGLVHDEVAILSRAILYLERR